MDEGLSGDDLRRELAELRASRARLVEEADRERRTIERSLHDGVQQHLVALAVSLQLARELVDSDPVALRALLEEVAGDTREALESVRALAHGVYPSLLLDRGLAEALRGAAAASTPPARVDIPATMPHYPAAIEASVYFCCVRALEVVAGAARAVAVRLQPEDDSLVFEVAAEGMGSGPAPSALTELSDRLGAVNGRLSVSSETGATRFIGTIPVPG